MTKIADMATIRDKEGNQIDVDIHGSVPEDPQDDYVLAAKAVWRLLKAKAERAPKEKAWQENFEGQTGWMWEGSMVSAIYELWPNISYSNKNAVHQGIRASIKKNVKLAVRGYGTVPSIWWLNLEWDDSVDIPRKALGRNNRKDKRVPTVDEQKTAIIAAGIELATELGSPEYILKDDIIKKTGILGGTLYKIFPTIQALRDAVSKEMQDGTKRTVLTEPLSISEVLEKGRVVEKKSEKTVKAPESGNGMNFTGFMEYVMGLEKATKEFQEFKVRLRELLEEFSG